MTSSPLIFLSYARADEAVVADLYKRLQAAGYKPWMDKQNIFGGESWSLAIENAIDAADLFIIVLSRNSVAKRGVLQVEIGNALRKIQEKLPSDIFLIPIRIEPCEPPQHLKKLQWIDYFEEDGWDRLKAAIAESMYVVKTYGTQEGCC